MAYSKVVQPYADALNLLLNTTVTDSRLVTLEGFGPAIYMITRFDGGEIQPLELGGAKWLHFRQQVLEDGNKLVVLEARYIFSSSYDIDEESAHVFRWEYLREPPAPHVPFGHLHVYGGGLQHIHFPTRQLSLEQIVWLIVQEWHVPTKRDDWYEVLKQGHRDFLTRTRESEGAMAPFP